MNEKDIIALYRKQVESSNETPPDTCWDDISTQLDLDDTWDYVAIELDKVLPLDNNILRVNSGKDQSSLARVISIASPFVLFLLIVFSDIRKTNTLDPLIPDTGISIVSVNQSTADNGDNKTPMISNRQDGETKVISNAKLVNQSEKKEPGFTLTVPVPFSNEMTAPKRVNSLDYPEMGLNNLMTYTKEEKVTLKNLKSQDPDNKVTFPPSQQIVHPVILVPFLVNTLVSGPVLVTGNEPIGEGSSPSGTKLRTNKFSVGISLTEKNTWLISQETLEGLDRQKLNTTKAKFLNDFGIIFRYTHSERWSFEGSCFLFSKTGQSYRQYLNGSYNTKSYELKYFSFEMSARHTFHRSLNINNVNFYSVAGAYISHLSSAYKRIDHSLYNISADFDPIDWGVLIGYEAEITLFNRFAVAPGFHIKLGIPNIFADQPGIPAELHSTRNASLEFRLNLILPLLNY